MTASHNLKWKKAGSKLFSGYFPETCAVPEINTASLKELIFPILNIHLSLEIVGFGWSFSPKLLQM